MPKAPASGGLGWFGVARHLVANVIEQGLNLPQAAHAIRAFGPAARRVQRPPLPTVTLAQIYMAQGHRDRALSTLDQVLARHPLHDKAEALRSQWLSQEAAPSRPAVEPAPASDRQAPVESDASAAAPPTAIEGDTAAVPALYPPVVASPKPASNGAERPRSLDSMVGGDQLVILISGEETYVCWELGTHHAAQGRLGDAELEIREYVPGRSGPQVRTSRLPLRNANGARVLERAPDSVVRAALLAREQGRWRVVRVATVFSCIAGAPQPLWAPRYGAASSEPAERAAQLLFSHRG